MKLNGFVKYTVGALALLAVMALFVAPFFIGIYAKYAVTSVINNLTSPYFIHAKISDSDTGWFSSTTHIKIWLDNPQRTTLTGTINTYNGPLVLFKDWRGSTHWYLNWFAAKGNLTLNDAHINPRIQSELPHKIFIAIRQNLKFDTIIHVHSPEMLLTLNHGHTQIGGITAHLFHAAAHNHIILHALLNDAKFDFPQDKTRVDLQYAAISLNITKDDTGLWTGNTSVYVPKAYLFDSAGRAKFIDTTLKTSTDLRDAKHYFDVSLNTQSIKLDNTPAGPLSVTGFVRHFYDQDLGNYVKMQKYVYELSLPDDLRKQALNPFESQLIQGVSGYITQAVLKTPSGDIKAGFSFKFPDVNANVRPVPTVAQMAHSSMMEFRLMAPIDVVKQPNILGHALQQFFTNGWLEKNNAEFTMHIQYTPSHGFLMNSKPWLQTAQPSS